MTTFINIHTLISHPSSMMNRDDSGLQKTAIFGGSTRSRISSQCLKRAIRQSEIYKKTVDEISIRTRLVDDLIYVLKEKIDNEDLATIDAVITMLAYKPKNLESNIKMDDEEIDSTDENGNNIKVKTGEKIRVFKSVQPYSVSEIRELIILARQESPEAFDLITAGLEKGAKKAEKEKFKKAVEKIHKLLPSVRSRIDIALSGRMDTNCYERNVEAAMSVAHSLTTHSADIEVDWFTACDDLAEQGSGHIGTTEFSSGVFYRYASINVDLLAKNTQKSKQELTAIIHTIIRCFAQVSPSAKQKTFAAHNHADFVLVAQSDQPLSLANAFRKGIKNNTEVMEKSIQSLVNHYEKIVAGYELNSQALAFDMTDTTNSEQIKLVNKLSELVFAD